MKTQFHLVSATAALAVLLTGVFIGGTSLAQTPVKAPDQVKPQGTSGDFLVHQGKHTMWKSQLEIMHPELARKATPLSKRAGTDYLVQIGKTPVLASTLRRVNGPKSTRPSPHGVGCKDYLVQSGKKVVWASAVGAPCPAGPHKGEQKPLCCVASVNDQKKLAPCCRAAQG